MFGPLRIKFTKKELIMFGFGALMMFGLATLMGAKDNKKDLEQCENERSSCEAELDECIAILR